MLKTILLSICVALTAIPFTSALASEGLSYELNRVITLDDWQVYDSSFDTVVWLLDSNQIELYTEVYSTLYVDDEGFLLTNVYYDGQFHEIVSDGSMMDHQYYDGIFYPNHIRPYSSNDVAAFGIGYNDTALYVEQGGRPMLMVFSRVPYNLAQSRIIYFLDRN